jgi:hypothetical protein
VVRAKGFGEGGFVPAGLSHEVERGRADNTTSRQRRTLAGFFVNQGKVDAVNRCLYESFDGKVDGSMVIKEKRQLVSIMRIRRL